jgi:heterodisulfide reductase subunit A
VTDHSGSPVGAVLVIGGGVAGIQASLDSAALGFRVYLVERSPMIGGRMAQLDKTFPTGDCSMCILSPKLIECQRHPNIDILAYTEVKAVEGKAGNFRVTLSRKPRYVREDLCVGCGLCTFYCPASAPDGFNERLSNGRAISLLCPQSVPLVSSINPDYCLFLKESKCKICAPVCKQRAINFDQTTEEIVIDVGAIIAAPGADLFDPTPAREYGYGRMANVVTSMEFERLLNAAGPSRGEVLRLSDGNIPTRIAWLQCVGSRDRRFGHLYCSAVCCTYAVKQVILAKEHHPGVQATVFFRDVRTFGKGFEEFYGRAKGLQGVRFLKSEVAVRENSHDRSMIVTYVTGDKSHAIQEEFDMVVLSVGLCSAKTSRSLANMLGLELDEHGFCRTDEFSPQCVGSRPGVFPAATFTGPMDIPDSIGSATGAVARASQLLASQRGTLLLSRQFPEERPVEAEEPRIGVFVCRCGANIGRVVDVRSVVDYAATLNGVIHAEENLFSCSADAGYRLAQTIRAKGLNRVVVAACTPRTHEPLFQDTLREAGINRHLIVMANIREHCSWVHSLEKEKATDKAKDLVGMAVARAANLASLKEIRIPVIKKGLVLGGGLAGMKAALSLAQQGFDVHLVEKETELGGNLKFLRRSLGGADVRSFLDDLLRRVQTQVGIEVLTGYELTALAGSVGNFRSTVSRVLGSNGGEPQSLGVRELEHGVIVVATGGKAYKPSEHEYCYGRSPRIITQQKFEDLLLTDPSMRTLRRVAMILCVGSRNKDRPYCSRVCCGQAIKNALWLKELNEDAEISIFYRDIRTYGVNEVHYARALEQGILFIPYEPEAEPELTITGDCLSLAFRDPVLDVKVEINPELVVLSTAIVPEGSRELAGLLKVPLTGDGFFMEAHMKLRPLDFASDGIFLCGTAHYPKSIPEGISQAEGAAARAATILSQDALTTSGAVCEIDEVACGGCGVCARVCPYEAVELYDVSCDAKARIVPTVCKGCGACAARCPSSAITNHHFKDEQILAQIDAAYSVPADKAGPRILAFLCNWCGYAGADLAGVSRIQYSPNIRVIRVMCSARVRVDFILRAFSNGVDGVLVVGCHEEDCHYISGIHEAARMVYRAKRSLARAGVDPDRLRLEHISAGEGARFAQVVDRFTVAMAALGHPELVLLGENEHGS